jgi:hypothetical protein
MRHPSAKFNSGKHIVSITDKDYHGWVSYPNRYAVSPKRAEEIKAEWRRMSAEVKE